MATFRVGNYDVSCFQTNQGKCHCDTVVSIGLNNSAINARRGNVNSVCFFCCGNSERVKVFNDGMDAVALLSSDVSDSVDVRRSHCKRGKRCNGERLNSHAYSHKNHCKQ